MELCTAVKMNEVPAVSTYLERHPCWIIRGRPLQTEYIHNFVKKLRCLPYVHRKSSGRIHTKLRKMVTPENVIGREGVIKKVILIFCCCCLEGADFVI